MSSMSNYRKSLWPMPPIVDTDSGHERRLGVEIEFAGIPIEKIAELIRAEFGGEISKVSDYELLVEKAEVGGEPCDAFGVELDYAYLKRVGKEREDLGEENFGSGLTESLLAVVAKQLVPYEIVCPPLAMAQLQKLEDLIAALRQEGAKGTKHATTYAFGLQLNPEMPDVQAKTILAYMRAFQCLYLWLRARSEVDLSRRLTPYIDPCGKDYLRLIMDDSYDPNIEQLIDDYLEYNPTRNRALDMLPLFAHIDEDRVRSKVDDDRIKPRPTLHYRLPNCQIDETDWGLICIWRDWLQVEALANDEKRLQSLCAAFKKSLDSLMGATLNDWGEASTEWLLPELL